MKIATPALASLLLVIETVSLGGQENDHLITQTMTSGIESRMLLFQAMVFGLPIGWCREMERPPCCYRALAIPAH